MVDIKLVKKGLIDHNGKETVFINKFSAYLDSINKRDKKGNDMTFGMSNEDMVKIFIKYDNIGIAIDGINAAITAYNRVFISWIGYKNKVLSVYPEAEFDVQLVREDDTISFAKESGSVIYTHSLGSPFASNKGIVGAYCVIKTKRGEALETLGKDDFEKMKSGSKLQASWDKWESEFWLKSVIKRACKRHFNDIVADIERVDNEDYSDEAKPTKDDKKKAILEAQLNDTVS